MGRGKGVIVDDVSHSALGHKAYAMHMPMKSTIRWTNVLHNVFDESTKSPHRRRRDYMLYIVYVRVCSKNRSATVSVLVIIK